MKKHRKLIVTVFMVAAMLCLFSTQAFAVSESDVQAAVDSSSKEAVSGNVFVWFLCAIAFLKVSQKIDSFMSSLGINVGHTGGSMIAEAMIAARGISAVKGTGGGFRGGGSSSGGRGAGGGVAAAASMMSGGLAGAVGRQFASGAVKNATGVSGGGIGGKMFTSSMGKGGGFANNVIGTVARGSMSAVGSMTGETASRGLLSYMGYSGMAAGECLPSPMSRSAAVKSWARKRRRKIPTVFPLGCTTPANILRRRGALAPLRRWTAPSGTSSMPPMRWRNPPTWRLTVRLRTTRES